MPKKKSNGAEPVIAQIPELKLGTVAITVKGVTSLVTNRFDAKTRKQMEDTQQGKAKHKKPPKDPKADYESSYYLMPGSKKKYGFPASGFKLAAVAACRFVSDVAMTEAKGAFHVLGDLVELKSDPPIMRTDTVRVGGRGKGTGAADIRYRAEFKNWSAKLIIRYNEVAITPSQIANLFNVAGFAIGVGEWRPEKDGQFGMFEVV